MKTLQLVFLSLILRISANTSLKLNFESANFTRILNLTLDSVSAYITNFENTVMGDLEKDILKIRTDFNQKRNLYDDDLVELIKGRGNELKKRLEDIVEVNEKLTCLNDVYHSFLYKKTAAGQEFNKCLGTGKEVEDLSYLQNTFNDKLNDFVVNTTAYIKKFENRFAMDLDVWNNRFMKCTSDEMNILQMDFEKNDEKINSCLNL